MTLLRFFKSLRPCPILRLYLQHGHQENDPVCQLGRRTRLKTRMHVDWAHSKAVASEQVMLDA